MSDCIFCKIAARQIPSKAVYEDSRVFAFEDINPQAPVHVLIIPKKHIPTALDIAPDDEPFVGAMFSAAAQIAREKKIAEPGFRLVMNTNAHAGQAVFHIHLHLLGGRQMHWPPG